MKNFLSLILFTAFIVLPSQAWAEKAVATLSPHERIQQATDTLLKEIPAAKSYFDADPERFFNAVDVVLSPVVDFKAFTRSVMGPFGQRNYYASLSSEQRGEFKTNYRAFVATFKKGLIRTYAKGLLVFDGQDISIAPATEADIALIAQGKAVTVVQTIKSTADTYTLRYKMMPNKKGEWVLRNVVLGSINVGKLYQNQFLSSMKSHNDDFSVVIKSWISETKDTDFRAEAKKTAVTN
ncbi:MAG: ABC transporter substrate-binding protein [Sinobacterium sp.]|nr:ABC transporter substrate-binding protein [Sinobacterium sp.]